MNIPATLPDWTTLSAAEKIDAIRPIWNDGKSANEISKYFANASRNAVISALSRGKMVGRGDPRPKSERTPKPRPSKPRRTPKPKPIAMTLAFTQAPDPDAPSQSVMDMINSDRPPLAGTTPIGILALPQREVGVCRWPVAGGLYCGVTCGDQVYCPTHHAIAYRPAERFRMPKEARR